MAERVAHLLGERLGDDVVAAHHGSLSKDRRLRVETRLRAGDLRALVATASLELGIDIGPVELVCQIGSPRSMATFLQRVGRSGHRRGGLPKGRLFPMTRDELVECCALLAGVRAGHLDAIQPPVAPLDILAQQIVAECAAAALAGGRPVRAGAPGRPLRRADPGEFDEVVDTGRPRASRPAGAAGRLPPPRRGQRRAPGRRGARLAALTSGGAIPETGDYRVVPDPDDTRGHGERGLRHRVDGRRRLPARAHSWRVRRVEPGTVRVVDAGGAPPTVPFWLGEAPARTAELSEEVSDLRAGVDGLLPARGGTRTATPPWPGWQARCGVDEAVAAMVVRYLAAGLAALGRPAHAGPHRHRAVLRRHRRDAADRPRPLRRPHQPGPRAGAAQAVLRLVRLRAAGRGQRRHRGALARPPAQLPAGLGAPFLSSATVAEVLRQAVLLSPMFAARWRWNLNRALAVLRFRGGGRTRRPSSAWRPTT